MFNQKSNSRTNSSKLGNYMDEHLLTQGSEKARMFEHSIEDNILF